MTKNENIFLLNKPAGLTPLQAIELLREKIPSYKTHTLSYAGRLDPMAEGLLLLLLDEENKNRHTYEHLSKTYEFQMLIGYATDTYDVMGMITEKNIHDNSETILNELNQFIPTFQGKQTLPYPPYSSKSVQGKPLYWYTIHNQLTTISYPVQDIDIHNFQIWNTTHLTSETILNSITNRLQKVRGEFRQQTIQEQWNHELRKKEIHNYLCISFTLSCGHGSYVRGIVNKLSQQISLPALTYTLKRTTIGPYTLNQAFRFDD